MKRTQSWWKTLSLRDQKLFLIWMVFMVMGAVYSSITMITALEDRIQAQLLSERKILNTMKSQSNEITQLNQTSRSNQANAASNSNFISNSLSKFNISPEIIQADTTEDQINIKGLVSFDKWIEWTTFVQKEIQLTIKHAKITSSPQPGEVEIRATLEFNKQ